jgi:hypothetical protein
MTRNIVFPDSSYKAIQNNDTYSYILKSNRLGWLNCDRIFQFNSPKMNFSIADKDPREVDMALVFLNARVILAPSFTHEGKIVFADVPKNVPVTIVAIKKRGNFLLYAVKEAMINLIPAIELDYREISSEKLRDELEKLNR